MTWQTWTEVPSPDRVAREIERILNKEKEDFRDRATLEEILHRHPDWIADDGRLVP